MIRTTLLLGFVAVSACGQKDSPSASQKPVQATCDALLLSSIEARGLRDQVGGQFASVRHAIDRAEQIEKKSIPPEQIGTDSYANAIQRAFSYKQTGFAVCYAALLVDNGMLELAMRTFDGAEVRDAGRQLTRVTCQLTAKVDTDAESRRAASAEWSAQSRDALEFENRLVQACYDKTGGVRPDFLVSPTLLPTE